MNACDRCGQPASMRVAEASVERWICPVCADALGGGPWLHKLADALARPRRRDGTCPQCGATQENARITGLVGCPLCYVAFDDEFWTSVGVPRSEWTRRDAW